MPETVVTTDARFKGVINGNLLIDTYAHFRGEGDVNFDIWPPYSKLLNLQFQCDFGRKRNPTAHAYGLSGAHVFLDERMPDGQRVRIGHKLETLGSNKFDFLSFCAWDGSKYVPMKRVEISKIWQWVLDNWNGLILPSATAEGIYFQPALTYENLIRSYCDGVHVGSEVLGECDGEIIWNDLHIEVSDVKKTTVTVNVEPDKPEAPEENNKAKSATDSKKKSEAVCSCDDVSVGDDRTVPILSLIHI